MVDVAQDCIDLLKASYNSSYTDSNFPQFHKITDVKRYTFDRNQDVIFIHRPRVLQQPAGIGTLGKHLTYSFDIDIRVIGEGQETHFLKVIDEVKRVLDSKITTPGSSYTILDPDSEALDLSDKSHKLWRFQIPVKFIKYVTARP